MDHEAKKRGDLHALVSQKIFQNMQKYSYSTFYKNLFCYLWQGQGTYCILLNMNKSL